MSFSLGHELAIFLRVRGHLLRLTFRAFFVFLFSVRSIISICFFIHCPPCCSPAALLLAPLPLPLLLLLPAALVEANRALRCGHARRAAIRARAAIGPESVILDVLATAICVYVCMMWMGELVTGEKAEKAKSRQRRSVAIGFQPGSSDANMSIALANG